MLLVVFSAFLMFGATAQVLNLGWGLWVTELFVFLGLPLVALQLLGRPAVPLGRPTARLVLFGVACGAINYFAWAVPLMSLAEHLFPKSVVELFSGAKIFENLNQIELALIIAGVSVAAPLCEEYFFRGVLQRGLTEWLGLWRGVFLTSLIFSAIHLDPVGFMARLELGVLFGLLALRTGSLWPGIFAHAANNLLSTSLYFLTREAARDEELLWYVPVALLVIGNLGLLLAWHFRPAHQLEPLVERAPRPLVMVLRPWAFGAALMLALLLGFDSRGVSLNLFDVMYPVSKEAVAELRGLRAGARAGEVPLSRYFEQRKKAHQ